MNFIQHYIKLHSVLKYTGVFPPVESYQEAASLAVHFRLKTEIIGTWLYCFTTELIGYQLQSIGFWYSYKHLAYVYSGKPKDGIADDESLDEIRARFGSQKIN